MFVRSFGFNLLEQKCVLNDKSYPSIFASFFFLDYAVVRWAFEDAYFIEVCLLDFSYLDVIFLHPVSDVV